MFEKVGIQITDSFINIIYGNKNKIIAADSIELEKGICDDGSIIVEKAVANKINNFFIESNVNIKKISFVISGTDIITRYTEVPIMADKALRETIYLEFSQFIPDIDNYYMDYEILGKVNSKEKRVYQIMLVAVPKEKINSLVKVTEMLNKKVDSIDILSNSLIRPLKKSTYTSGNGAVGVFYLGVDTSSFTIIENNVFKIERALPFGIKNLFIESYDEIAATVLVDNNVDLKEVLEQNQRFQNSFENILSTINNTLRYYNSQRNNEKVEKLVIVCGQNTIAGLDAYFEKYFNIPCLLIKNPKDIDLKVNFQDGFNKYMATYGLLLRGN